MCIYLNLRSKGRVSKFASVVSAALQILFCYKSGKELEKRKHLMRCV